MSLIAAWMFPFSSFDETAWARRVSGGVDLRLAENSLLGVKTAPGLNSEIRLLMLLVRLCLLQPRFGGCKTETPQLNRDSQLELSVGLATIARNKPAKCEAQAERADFGMCLIIGRPEGAHSDTGSKTVWADEPERSLFATGDDTVTDASGGDGLLCWLTTPTGGLWKPGHGLSRGPCLCTVQSFKWSCLVARQTLQTPFDLFASWEKGQWRV